LFDFVSYSHQIKCGIIGDEEWNKTHSGNSAMFLWYRIVENMKIILIDVSASICV